MKILDFTGEPMSFFNRNNAELYLKSKYKLSDEQINEYQFEGEPEKDNGQYDFVKVKKGNSKTNLIYLQKHYLIIISKLKMQLI